MVKYTTSLPCIDLSESDSKLYTNFEFCKGKNHKHSKKNTLMYKVNKFMLTTWFSRKIYIFEKMVQVVCKYIYWTHNCLIFFKHNYQCNVNFCIHVYKFVQYHIQISIWKRACELFVVVCWKWVCSKNTQYCLWVCVCVHFFLKVLYGHGGTSSWGVYKHGRGHTCMWWVHMSTAIWLHGCIGSCLYGISIHTHMHMHMSS